MRNKRMLVLVLVAGLLAALTSRDRLCDVQLPSSRAGHYRRLAHADRYRGLAGVRYGLWSRSTATATLDVNSFRETNPGIWMGSGNTYVLTFWGYLFDEQGKPTAREECAWQSQWTAPIISPAEGVTDTFDLAGEP